LGPNHPTVVGRVTASRLAELTTDEGGKNAALTILTTTRDIVVWQRASSAASSRSQTGEADMTRALYGDSRALARAEDQGFVYCVRDDASLETFLKEGHDTILVHAKSADGVIRRFPRLASANVTIEAAA